MTRDITYVLSGPRGSTILSVGVYRETRDREETEQAPAPPPPPMTDNPTLGKVTAPTPTADNTRSDIAAQDVAGVSAADEALVAQLSDSFEQFQEELATLWQSVADFAAANSHSVQVPNQQANTPTQRDVVPKER